MIDLNTILTIPESISPLTLSIIIFASFISSFISSIVGFGGGMLLLGILALNFPVSKVIPLHAVIQLGSNLNRLFFFRFKVKWNIFLPFALGCIIGIPIGGIFFYSVNEDFLKILVAFFITFNVINKFPTLSKNKMFLTGIISSFLSTIIGVTGSLISSVVQSFNLSKPEYISSCAFLLFTQHICKCILFGLMGFAFYEYNLLIILVILSGILGTFAGKNIIYKIPDRFLKLGIRIILLLISLNLFINGLINILPSLY